ncbi:MAG: hypothetical protein RLZZ174_40 [Pseudomonadota bacterium]
MALRFLNPSHEAEARAFTRALRPASLVGATVGFISNGKEGTKGFFTHLEALLRARLGVAEVRWLTKGNYSAPAEAAILVEAGNWDFAITGLGD